MALTYADVQAAHDNLSAARSALEAAQAEEAQIVNDPAARATGAYDAAKSKTAAARERASQAERDYRNIQSQFNRQNPAQNQRPMTPGQQSEDDRKVREEQERQKNLRETGIPDTNAQRADREARNGPRQPRADSPAQIQNANTASQNAAERERANRQREETAIINAHRQALRDAGLLAQNISKQVSDEAQAQVQAQQKGIDQVFNAGKTLLEQDTQKRQRDLELKKTRSQFFNSMLSSAMPQVAELMMKSGGKAAAAFLKVYVMMANEAYTQAKLDQEEPPFDVNSPWYKNLVKIAGYETPDRIPEMPTAAQINGRTAQRMALIGTPLPGWQGPIGVDVLQMPEFPPNVNGEGVDPVQDAAQTPEGKAIRDEIQGRVKDIMAIPAAQRTPEQQAQLAAAQEEYKSRMGALAQRRQAVPRASAAVDESQQLKQELRAGLTAGSQEQRLGIMASAMAGVENRKNGLPLTGDQQAVLSNLDPEDIAIIQQYMTPDVAQILLKHVNRQPISQEEIARVNTVVTEATTKIKERPVAIPQPAGQPVSSATTGTDQQASLMIDPEVVKAQEQEHQARKAERDAIWRENPELDAMMTQVEEENRALGAQARADGAMVQMPLTSIRQQAEERLRAGEKPKSEFYGARPADEAPIPQLQGPGFIENTQWGPQPGQPETTEQPWETPPGTGDIPDFSSAMDRYKDKADQMIADGSVPDPERSLSAPWPTRNGTPDGEAPIPDFSSMYNPEDEEDPYNIKPRKVRSLFSDSFSWG